MVNLSRAEPPESSRGREKSALPGNLGHAQLATSLTSSPPAPRLPDFIIAGAMKCGTTSLHTILANHPRVFIPPREIHFFDIDEILQHPDFFFHADDRWHYPSLRQSPQEYWAWYHSFFEAAGEHQLIGEDSTTYLTSTSAAERIAGAGKEILVIIMLRDPADRAFSNYWHLVRTGRATQTFEETIQREPYSVLGRSLYRNQIVNFLRFVPRQRIHFVIFEEFVRNIGETTRGVCKFLGLDAELIADLDGPAHSNEGDFPTFPQAQLWRNRILRHRAKGIYREHLLDVPSEGRTSPIRRAMARLVNLLDRVHSTANPPQTHARPRMREETRRMLDDYFLTQNSGLSELIGTSVEDNWYHSIRGGVSRRAPLN
jgi:hypothetical protein